MGIFTMSGIIGKTMEGSMNVTVKEDSNSVWYWEAEDHSGRGGPFRSLQEAERDAHVHLGDKVTVKATDKTGKGVKSEK